MVERIGVDPYFLRMAALVSARSTCARRSVGAVLVSARRHVLATGYNGRPSGERHCAGLGDAQPCPAASAASGTHLDGCEAIHAEQNALLQCRDVYAIATCYVSVSPCVHCVKLLMNTTCQRIVFAEPYAHDAAAKELWSRQLMRLTPPRTREWVELPP